MERLGQNAMGRGGRKERGVGKATFDRQILRLGKSFVGWIGARGVQE